MTGIATVNRSYEALARVRELASIASDNLHAAEVMAHGTPVKVAGNLVPTFVPEHLHQFGGAEGAAKGALQALEAAKQILDDVATGSEEVFATSAEAISQARAAAIDIRDASNVLRRAAEMNLVERKEIGLASGHGYSMYVPTQGGHNIVPESHYHLGKSIYLNRETVSLPDPSGARTFLGRPRMMSFPKNELVPPRVPDSVFRGLEEIGPDPVVEQQIAAAAKAARSADEGKALGDAFMRSALTRMNAALEIEH